MRKYLYWWNKLEKQAKRKEMHNKNYYKHETI